MIPYGHQCIEQDDVDAVVAVLAGEWLTTGPHVEAFERELAEKVEARHAVTFSSGTAALHAAMAAAGISPGDRVATSTLTFAASANCARYVGATPVLVDIDAATYNFDVLGVPDGVAALVAVHYAGLSADLSRLPSRPRIVVEDASHALGARTPDGPVGNCARSEMCVFSFHPVKAITTAEGGAITTNSDELADALRRFRNHGIVRKPAEGDWYYEIDSTGYNYRLTDVQAALGSSQLRKLDRFVSRRRELADRYRSLLADLPITLPPEPPTGHEHAYHLFAVRVPNRRQVFDVLRGNGIGVQVHYVPVYRHGVFAECGTAKDFPVTEEIYAGLLSLPLYPSLTERDQDTVVAELRAALCAKPVPTP